MVILKKDIQAVGNDAETGNILWITVRCQQTGGYEFETSISLED